MQLKITCPRCQGAATIPAEVLGRTVVCPACAHQFVAHGEDPGDDLVAYQPCPHCGMRGRVARDKLGKNATCPGCGKVLLLRADGPPPPSPAVAPPRSAPPPPPLPPSRRSGAASPGPEAGGLAFPGAWTPQIAMLEKEEVLDTFEASVLDLGLLPWLLAKLPGVGPRVGGQARMVLTTHRLFAHDRRLLQGNRLRIYWLHALDGVHLGTQFRPLSFFVGLWFVLMSLFGVYAGIVARLSMAMETRGLDPALQQALAPAWSAWLVLWMLFLAMWYGTIGVLGVLILLTAWEKGMYVCVSGVPQAGLQLALTRSEEGRRFAEKVFTMLHYNARTGMRT